MHTVERDTAHREDDRALVLDREATAASLGRAWLVDGAVLAAICVGGLLLQSHSGVARPVAGSVVVGALYAAMVAVRVVLRGVRLRVAVMAVLFAAIAAWTLAWLLVIVEHSG